MLGVRLFERSTRAVALTPAGHAWLPSDGLVMSVVATEPRFVVLPDDHPLAGRTSVALSEIAELPWMEFDSDPIWCDFWRVTEQRTKPATLGPRGRTLEDLLEAARAARATALVPACIATATAWPGLVFIPIPDVPPSSIAVAWPEDGESALVRAFVAVANQVATTGVR
jgi:DNA-binding transcriptional LysR family regulator